MGPGIAWRPRPPGRQFDDARRAHPDWPRVLGEGDSWFSHPLEWNILYHLSAGGGYAIRRIATTGAEMRDRVFGTPAHPPHFVRQLRRRGVGFELLLWSGGGNDLLGEPLTRMLRRRAEVPRGWRGLIRDGVVASELDRIRGYYERVIFLTARVRPGCEILAHGYDHPIPRDRGAELFWGHLHVAGPWMHPVLVREKGIRDPEVQRRIAAELVDRFNDVLAGLAAVHPHFHHVDLRGTLRGVRDWSDEIHPTSAGFRRMALRFRERMDALVGRRG